MMSDDFGTSYQREPSSFCRLELLLMSVHSVVMKLKTERGLALQDLLTGAYEYFETLEFPPAARVYLLDKLATTECV